MGRSRSTTNAPADSDDVSVDTSAATMGALPTAQPSTATAAGSTKSSSDYVNFLLSYEGMVRHQDLEFDATKMHMQSVFDRVKTLGSKRNADGEVDREESAPGGMLTYLQIRRCLLRLGVGWNRCVPASGDAASDYDDDVSVLSFNSASSGHSGLSGGAGKGDIISTDAQLIMLLTTLVEMEERYRASKMPDLQPRGKVNLLEQGLFLPEFILAYKLIIGGMQSLKCIKNPDGPNKLELCNRLKDRTLGMLRPFGPNATMYSDPSRETDQTDALSPKGSSLRSNVAGRSPKRRAELGLSNGEMKQVMRSKDSTLAKIMEDHELEMDALASSMEELQAKEQRLRVSWKRRRRRLKGAAFLLGSALLGGGIAVEMRRRKYLDEEIRLGREAERKADAELIAQLTAKRQGLEEELGVIEGKMRYQVNRNEEIEAQAQTMEKKVDNVDMKWLLDKAEIERCSISLVAMREELKHEQSKQGEVGEELTWCNSRLRSQERALNELEHISVKRSDKSLISKSTGDSSKGHKPVYLEMKYNKSIRNAMLLRQAYSAAAGLAVSALLQGIVPTVARMLFASKAAVVVPPPVAPTQDVEMMLVDGIFGSSVLFLLIRGIATFFVPL